MSTPPPTIRDLDKEKIFTPGAEGSEYLLYELTH